MKKVELSSTKTIAFYNRDEALEYLTNEIKTETLVGADMNVEELEIEDVRTSTKLKMYTVTTFHDLAQAR